MAEEILIQFGEKGAGIVIDRIKKVQKSVDQLKSDMKSPLGPTLDAKMFNTAAVDKAAVSLNHLGIEYDRVKSKMKSPLGSGTEMQNMVRGFSTGNIKKLNEDLKKTGDVAKDAGFQLGFVSRILAAMAIRAVAREVLQLADAFTTLQNKLKTVSDVRDVGFISKELFKTAQDARVSLESVVTMYSRTRRAVQDLGKSQLETMKFSDALAKAVTVGGSSAMEASNAMIQLSQGMGSGALRGDELRSVLEQLPIVAELIAKKMGKPVSALRSLGAEGALTTQVVFDAITENADYIEEKLSKMDLTVGQAFTRLKNQAVVAAEGLQGAMKHLADAIQWVTNNFDTLITAMEGLLFGVVTLAGIKGIQMLVIQVKALNAATNANKIILLATAITTVAAALAPFIFQLRLASDSVVTFGDVMEAAWDEIKDKFNGSDGPEKKVEELNNEMYKLSETTRKWTMYLATALDYLTNMTPGINVLKMGIGLVNGSNPTSLIRDTAQSVMDRTDANKEQEMIQNALRKQREMEAQKRLEDEAYAARLRGAYKPPPGKEKNPAGLKFHELIEDLGKSRDKAYLMDDSSTPNMQARIAREWMDAVDKLEDNVIKNMTAAQSKKIESMIEEKIILEDMLKLREQIQKSMKEEEKAQVKQLIDGIQEMVDREEKNKKLVLQFQEDKAEREIKRFEDRKAMMSKLDPRFAVNEEIKELETFIKQNKGFTEGIKLAQDRIEELRASLNPMASAFKTFGEQMNSIFGQNGMLVRGFADVAARALVMNSSLKDTKQAMRDLLDNISTQALSALFQLPLNMAVSSLSAPKLAGMSSGGYTGNMSTSSPAAVVHGQEFVLNAGATKSIGVDNLNFMNKTGSVPSAGSGVNVTVNNNAGVIVETKSLSPGEIEIMISRAVKDQAPHAVAGAINDPSSLVSKSLNKNLEAQRRRL